MMPRLIATAALLLLLALPAGAGEGLKLTVGLDDGTLIEGTDLIIVTAGSKETSLFEMEHLMPDKLLSIEPRSAAIEVVPLEPEETDRIRQGPFTAPNPLPGNKLRIPGSGSAEVDGLRLKFMVVQRGDWEDRLDYLKARHFGGGSQALRDYLQRHPGGRANSAAYEVLGPTWADEILARDVAADNTADIIEFLDGSFKYIPVKMQQLFPEYLHRYIAVHRDAGLIGRYTSLFPDSPFLSQVQAIEGDRQLEELLARNPGKTYGELLPEITRLGNEFYASPELHYAWARAYLETGKYDDALRAFYISQPRIERMSARLEYGMECVLNFVNASPDSAGASQVENTLREALPFAVADESEHVLTAAYMFAQQRKDRAADSLGVETGTLVSAGQGYNAFLLLVMTDLEGDVLSVRIASSEWYTLGPESPSRPSPEDLTLALIEKLPETLESFVN